MAITANFSNYCFIVIYKAVIFHYKQNSNIFLILPLSVRGGRLPDCRLVGRAVRPLARSVADWLPLVAAVRRLARSVADWFAMVGRCRFAAVGCLIADWFAMVADCQAVGRCLIADWLAALSGGWRGRLLTGSQWLPIVRPLAVA